MSARIVNKQEGHPQLPLGASDLQTDRYSRKARPQHCNTYKGKGHPLYP